MSQAFKDKIKTIRFGGERKAIAPKRTTDVHDHHAVDVTEHWNDRVDVNVKMEQGASSVNPYIKPRRDGDG